MQYADPTKLRAYFFGNMYLSPIQQGIQCSHVVTKMFDKYQYSPSSAESVILYDWADVGVTKILLNGGYQSNLTDVYSILEIVCPKLGLPYAKFHEEEAALNGALTSVGVVVPEEVYSKDPLLVWDWTQPAGTETDMGYLRDCITPADILERVKLYEGVFANRDLREDFLETALHLTLKTARLA